MDIEYFCPLDKQCEYVKKNTLYRCRWFVALRGKHPQSEEIIDDWQCALYWTPILLVENAQTNRGQTQALESFRNEVVKGQNSFNRLLSEAMRRHLE